MAERLREEDILIWPENWDAWQVFTACATQWRVGPSGHRLGLIYMEAIAVMEVYGIDDRRDCLDALRVMETAALEVWSAAS